MPDPQFTLPLRPPPGLGVPTLQPVGDVPSWNQKTAPSPVTLYQPTAVRSPTTAVYEMSPTLDPLSLQFAIEMRAATRQALDIGCGDGVATAAALARGGRVLAVDPDLTLLGRLVIRIPREQRARLKIQAGSLPGLDFAFPTFAAIHAARVLHLLDGAGVEHSLRKFFRWLYPLGKLFISVLTPKGPCWEPFQAEIARRGAAGARWPGYIHGWVPPFAADADHASGIHLLDEVVLRRELEAAGFVIKEVGCYPLPWDREQMCCAIIAGCNV